MTSWYDLTEMPFNVLVAKCPKTGKDLLFGQDFPFEDFRYPTIRLKSIMDFPLTVARCPIIGCGEQHTFAESQLREKAVTIPEPESREEYAFGEFMIEMEFYKHADGRYQVWPYLKKVGLGSQSKIHFTVEAIFPTKDVARAVALRVGQDKISEGLAV